MADKRAVLYAFAFSSCSWRVRAALHLKQIPFEEKSVDIIKDKHQLTEDFRKLNPAKKVPVLNIDGVNIVESMAIVQYLDDTRPEPSLIPADPLLKARMREICEIVVSGIQPLQNVNIFTDVTNSSKEDFIKFGAKVCEKGLQSLEDLIPKTAEQFCIGDQLTMADLCLVPQVYNAVEKFHVKLDKFPTIAKLYENLLKNKAIQDAHPKNVKITK